MNPQGRIWSTQEIQNIIMALFSAPDALPWYLRWTMRGWQQALAAMGYALGAVQEAVVEQEKLEQVNDEFSRRLKDQGRLN